MPTFGLQAGRGHQLWLWPQALCATVGPETLPGEEALHCLSGDACCGHCPRTGNHLGTPASQKPPHPHQQTLVPALAGHYCASWLHEGHQVPQHCSLKCTFWLLWRLQVASGLHLVLISTKSIVQSAVLAVNMARRIPWTQRGGAAYLCPGALPDTHNPVLVGVEDLPHFAHGLGVRSGGGEVAM